MGLEDIDLFKFWVSPAYNLYLSLKIGCVHSPTKRLIVARKERRFESQTQYLEIRLKKVNQQRRSGQRDKSKLITGSKQKSVSRRKERSINRIELLNLDA